MIFQNKYYERALVLLTFINLYLGRILPHAGYCRGGIPASIITSIGATEGIWASPHYIRI